LVLDEEFCNLAKLGYLEEVESNGDGHDEDAPPETTVGENDILGGELTFQVSGDYILKIPEFGKIAKFLVENQVVIPNDSWPAVKASGRSRNFFRQLYRIPIHRRSSFRTSLGTRALHQGPRECRNDV
jgi:hypothetical protein